MNYLNEYPNRDETTSELNLYSHINYDNTSLLGNRNSFEDKNMNKFNSDSYINFNIGSLLGSRSNFEDEYTN